MTKNDIDKNETDDTSSGQQGGSSGIAFVDFTKSGAEERDDLLTDAQKRQLISAHKITHESRVNRQKAAAQKIKDVKDQKMTLEHFRQENGASSQSEYKQNPALADKAQFSGIDRQVNALPNENTSEANQEKRDELTYEYQLQFKPENTPKFNPKPQFP